jgi:UPF0042 nucleotide-binding protein
MDVKIVSFGYGHGVVPTAHVTLDLRHHFKDPHVSPSLRGLTARDRSVRKAVLATAGIKQLIGATVRQVQAFHKGPSDGTVVVAVGCVGGRHRSATVAQHLARRLTRRGLDVTLVHLDLHRPVIVR